MKILIVEDEPIMLNSLMEKFTQEGFEAIQAMDGEEGLKKALEVHPDLILLDILLPKMDGLKMLEKLRQDEWGSDAKVIILTNVDDAARVAQAMKAAKMNESGLLTYLVKTGHSLENVVEEVKKQLQLTKS